MHDLYIAEIYRPGAILSVSPLIVYASIIIHFYTASQWKKLYIKVVRYGHSVIQGH